ncbi:MAG: hypothetical protein OEW08_13310, partial [Gammaproteobacteria bacterium]|nr:hypothetical protein [Gammaproteobacteria bacterium]
AGCTRIGYAVGGGWKGVCGGGVGGVTTAWIPQRGEHHALTLYVGVDRLLDRDANTSARLRNSTHLAAGYYYFFNGLPNDGWNAGIAPVVEISGGTQRGLYMGLGYQFH